MMRPTRTAPPLALAMLMAGALSACARDPQPVAAAAPQAARTLAAATPVAPTTVVVSSAQRGPETATSPRPRMLVHRSPTCGCCAAWVEHVRKAGFLVEVRDTDNLDPVKTRLGIPVGKGSCHTAEVGGYFIEGHVPATDIDRLLAQKPDAKGLVVPGMPLGSPGMEVPDGSTQAYAVQLIGRDGASSTFAEHGH